MERFDAIVIGTGQAGPALAARLAGAGKRVAVVERKLFGGTCVNTGCIPTKTMVASAAAAQAVRRAGEYGVSAALHSVDMRSRSASAAGPMKVTEKIRTMQLTFTLATKSCWNFFLSPLISNARSPSRSPE